ncbi:MAG: hypothetical protein V1723_00320 [Candidatus Uhrbacteria bacterium]
MLKWIEVLFNDTEVVAMLKTARDIRAQRGRDVVLVGRPRRVRAQASTLEFLMVSADAAFTEDTIRFLELLGFTTGAGYATARVVSAGQALDHIRAMPEEHRGDTVAFIDLRIDHGTDALALARQLRSEFQPPIESIILGEAPGRGHFRTSAMLNVFVVNRAQRDQFLPLVIREIFCRLDRPLPAQFEIIRGFASGTPCFLGGAPKSPKPKR